MQADIDHIQEIEAMSQRAAFRGARSVRDPIVVESWLRCLEKHGLDPAARSEAYIVPDSALRFHRQRSEDLISIARSGIDGLYKLVAGQNYVLLLSDSAGVTVEYLGEAAQKDALRKSGLYLGAEWSEARAGTCALGACIESGEPLIIHQSDHFDVSHGALSCTAAPIYDTSGALTAVLDVSLLSSPMPRASQFLALNLVRQAARRIEMANIMAESRRDWVLRLAGSPDFLDVDPEAALSLDSGGRVIGMTNGAARLMARSLGLDWREGARLIGRHVSEVFDLGLETLEGLTRQRDARDRFIETRDGYRLFAHAIEPQRSFVPRIARARHIPAELRDLAGDDPGMTQLLEQAAALANGQMPLLIDGESGAGKSTLARAIHAIGRRGPCVTVACETIDEDESAILFGREDKRHFEPGLIDAAEGGTLILDNLEDLPPRLQARLVSLLTEHSYRPVGATRERRSNARIIVTTAADLADLAARNSLRRDLLHRVSGTRLSLPALRHRRDILGLADKLFAQAFGTAVRFDATAVAALANHDWTGNLHALTSLATTLAATIRQPGGSSAAITLTDKDFPPHLRAQGADHTPNAQVILGRLLDEAGWNVSAVARQLGVDRSTIHRQILRYGLSRA